MFNYLTSYPLAHYYSIPFTRLLPSVYSSKITESHLFVKSTFSVLIVLNGKYCSPLNTFYATSLFRELIIAPRLFFSPTRHLENLQPSIIINKTHHPGDVALSGKSMGLQSVGVTAGHKSTSAAFSIIIRL